MDASDLQMAREAITRWRDLVRSKPTRRVLQEFHAQHKMLYLARGAEPMRELGRLAAAPAERFEEALDAYGRLLTETLARVPTEGGHVDALQHLVGHLPPGSSTRGEAAALVAGFRDGRVTFEAAREGVRARLTDAGTDWARMQAYLREQDV